LIPRIRATLASARDDDELVDDNSNGNGLRPYSLAPLGGTPFSLDATLETLAIDDGEQLILCKLPPGPAAAPVVEDIADASAIHSANQFKPFEHTMLSGLAQVVVWVLGTLVCGLAIFGWHRGYNQWAAVALAVPALVFAVATYLLHRRAHESAAGRMGIATAVPLALAGAASLPGDGAAPRVFLAAALLVAWTLLLLVVTNNWVALHTATVAVSATVAVAAAARTLLHFPYLTLGCGLLAVSLLLASNAPTVSAVWARFPLPTVPAPGEPTPPPSTLAEIEDLPRKTATSNSYQSGLIAAAVILSVAGSALVLWLPAAPGWLAWWLVLTVMTVTVLRMRIWDSAIPALWFLATPFLVAATLSVSFTATNHVVAGLFSAAALAVLTVLLLVASALKPRELTIPQRRWLDLFENTLLITIVPVMLWLVGLISLIRNRGAL
jgi:type VII secretion integral membrane protein EccD